MPIDYLPRRVQPMARRLRDFILDDSFVILILGVGVFLQGVLYAAGFLGPLVGTHPVERIIPIAWWGFIWILVGGVCVVSGVIRNPVLEAVALALAVGLYIAWGFSYLVEALSGPGTVGVYAIVYFTITTVTIWSVWRGRRGDVRRGKDG